MLSSLSQETTDSFSHRSPTLPPANVTLSPSAEPSRHFLLAICDNPSCPEFLQGLFKDQVRIGVASTLKECESILKTETPSLVLCHFGFPVDELTRTLKEAHIQDVPILLISSAQERSHAASLLDSTVVDLLTEPFEPREVHTRVLNYLQISLAKKALSQNFAFANISLEQLAEEVTQRSRELDRTNRLKDEFLAMLSHELRNPINVISGFAEILLDKSDDSDLAREAAQTIYRNAQYQAKLIQDLMDVSRSANGKMILDCRPIELAAVVRDILPAAESAVLQKNICLNFHRQTEGLISGDFTRLTQVIWNLISNAVKFTPDGGKVDLTIQKQDGWVEFSVQDTGVGIDPAFLPFIFEQFHQQDLSITKRFGGPGLGLTIVKNIVELHRGRVKASSDGVGQGATFLIQLPALLS